MGRELGLVEVGEPWREVEGAERSSEAGRGPAASADDAACWCLSRYFLRAALMSCSFLVCRILSRSYEHLEKRLPTGA